MKKYILTVVILSFFGVMYGQISTNEAPVSFERNIRLLTTGEKTVKTLPQLDMKKIELEDKEDEAGGMPPRFGFPHKVSYSLDNSGEWTELSNGDKIWRLSIHCPGALSINLLYDKFWLPDGVKFFVYNSDNKYSIGAFTSANNKGGKTDVQGFATGLIYGDHITLEYYWPYNVQETGIISVAYVVHGYRYIVLPESMQGQGYGDSGDCQVNVNCSEGQNWQNEKNAVAMILVGGTRWCSGSLINTTENNAAPYFLTANHCLQGPSGQAGDAIANPDLYYWSFYWHYESPGCANAPPPIKSTVSATVVANNSISDFALLRLVEDPMYVTGITPYYLGWDRSGNGGTGGVCIHHPEGDIKKIATYTLNPATSVCAGIYFWNISFVQTSNGFSVMQPGSSGAPLINSNKKIIGQLYGPYWCTAFRCDNPAFQVVAYGKFDVSWVGTISETDTKRRLKDWLDPGNTGIPVLNGCGSVFNFVNQTVTTTTTITNSCGGINVQNVKVQNGAKLTLDAIGEVNIISDFEVELGSEFEIK